MLAIMLAGLLAIMAPSAFANQGNVTLDSAIVDAPEKDGTHQEILFQSQELSPIMVTLQA